MKTWKQTVMLAAAVLAVGIALVGCNGGDTEDESKALQAISVDAEQAVTQYYVGDAFTSENVIVTASYSDGTSRVVDNEEVSFSGFDSSTAIESQTITASYTENSITRTATYSVSITEQEEQYEEGDTLAFTYSFEIMGNAISDSFTAPYEVWSLLDNDGVNETYSYIIPADASAETILATFNGTWLKMDMCADGTFSVSAQNAEGQMAFVRSSGSWTLDGVLVLNGTQTVGVQAE